MIKKIWFALILLLYIVPNSLAQTVIPPTELPTCDQLALFNKIQQEHQLTRKFMIDTYEQKSADFYQKADSRMNYLEQEYRRQLNRAVFTLGFLWLFIVLAVNSLFGLMRIWLQQRQYKKLKKDIAQETMAKLKDELDKQTQVTTAKERPSIEIVPATPSLPPKMQKAQPATLEEVYERMKKVQ
jgi:hypothetical protein